MIHTDIDCLNVQIIISVSDWQNMFCDIFIVIFHFQAIVCFVRPSNTVHSFFAIRRQIQLNLIFNRQFVNTKQNKTIRLWSSLNKLKMSRKIRNVSFTSFLRLHSCFFNEIL